MDRKYLIVAIVAVCVIAGCVTWFGFYDNSKRALAGDVAEFNRRCPIEMAPGNVIVAMAYDTDANNVNVDVVMTNGNQRPSHDAMTDMVTLLFQEAENRHLLKDIVKSGACATLNYISGGDHVSIYKEIGVSYADAVEIRETFPSEEMAALEQKPLLTGKERALISLRNRVIMLSGMCPMEWSKGSELVNAATDTNSKQLLLYIKAGKVSATDYQIKLFKSELKANRREMSLVRDIVKELAAVGYGIKVCYIESDSNKKNSDLHFVTDGGQGFLIPIGHEIDISAHDINNISQLR